MYAMRIGLSPGLAHHDNWLDIFPIQSRFCESVFLSFTPLFSSHNLHMVAHRRSMLRSNFLGSTSPLLSSVVGMIMVRLSIGSAALCGGNAKYGAMLSPM